MNHFGFPAHYNRSCVDCGCAREQCECADRQVRSLTTLERSDELLRDLDGPPDPIFGHGVGGPQKKHAAIERVVQDSKQETQ